MSLETKIESLPYISIANIVGPYRLVIA